MKKVFYLLIIFSSCFISKINSQSETDFSYSKAFCALINAKQNFRTPQLKGDSIRILDHYYIDTSSLYYHFTNLSYELRFRDTINFPQFKGKKKDWEVFQIFNSLMNVKYQHQQDDLCLVDKKIKFIGREEISDQFQEYNTLLYSPLIEYKKNHYKIYEHRLTQYSDYNYIYLFKKVNNSLEFLKRTYHTELFISIQEDYMKTVNFNQTYEQFLASRK